jgi:hypothetical protein
MPYVSPEAILQAKQMDLLTYLQNYEPNELVHVSGNVFCTKTHDSLKISNGKWCWFSRGIGGKSALDYLIKVKEIPFVEAVEQIVGQVAVRSPAFHRQENKKQEKKLILPERNINNDKVKAYLEGRGIHSVIIDYCIKTKRLYEGKEHNNCVFVGYDLDDVPRYGVVRGTSGIRYLGEVLGSDKHFSFSIPASAESDTLHLFESAIDLLSFATLELFEGKDWRSTNQLSLAGVYPPKKDDTPMNTPLALSQYLKNRPHIRTIKLHLDNDYVGKMATKALIVALTNAYTVIDEPPKNGKDYNDQLRNLVGLSHFNKEIER